MKRLKIFTNMVAIAIFLPFFALIILALAIPSVIFEYAPELVDDYWFWQEEFWQ